MYVPPDKSKALSNQLYAEYLTDAVTPPQQQGGGWKERVKCAPLSWLLSLFPILYWLPRYKFREQLTYDLVAGCTVCVMQIPQGMAYALLANVQPVVGIYMAFFPVIVYSFMGTSKHISMGTFAVTCLMTGKTVTTLLAKYNNVPMPDEDDIDNNATAPTIKYTAEEIATVISLVTGLFQMLMGTLRLGFLCVLLSSDLVSGFTTGAAVHVFTSQVKNLLGLSIPRRNGLFKIPLTYYDIFAHISESNTTAIIFSVVTLCSLIIYNEWMKPHVAKHLSLPIPIELVTIVVGTLVSRYWITSEKYGFPIVNHIPTGFPAPSVPPLLLIKDVLLDSFVLAIVAYTISISMAKIFAAKHNYQVAPNQELLANGASNIVGSFFSCAPISCSLSRSVIQEQVGGRTQLASLVNCFLIIFVLLWIAPFFETLPHCVLSSMIMVALKGMLMQLCDVPCAFRESLLNAIVWCGTFLATVFLDIEYGLFVGVLLALINLIWRSNCPHIQLLSVHQHSDGSVLVDHNSPNARHISGVRIVKYTGALNFATIEYFAKKLQSLVPLPTRSNYSFGRSTSRISKQFEGILNSVIEEEEDEKPTTTSSSIISKSISTEAICPKDTTLDTEMSVSTGGEDLSWLLLDLSSTSSIDPAATKALVGLNKLYLKGDVNLLFVGCAAPLIQVMDKSLLLKVAGTDHFHPTIHSALNFLQRGLVFRRHSSAVTPTTPIPPSTTLDLSGAHVGEEEEDSGDEGEQYFHPTVAYFRRVSNDSSH